MQEKNAASIICPMIIPETDLWNISPKKGIELQKKLKREIKLTPLESLPETVAGADVS